MHDGHRHDGHYDHHHGGGQPISETIVLRTVGIDIGSSTTHVMFARVELERDGRRLSSAYRVVRRTVDHASPIFLTPYLDAAHIDTGAVGRIIDGEYAAAGIAPADIDSGAVIVTGEAAMKANADPIVQLFASQGGRFVCASAGPNLEATLAAHGSGAVRASAGGDVSLNVDVGGGTTKLALCAGGQVVETAAFSVGARLLAWDDDRVLTRVERAVGLHLDQPPAVGDKVDDDLVSAAVGRMCDVLFAAVTAALRGEAHAGDAYLTDPLPPGRPVSAVSFSGGVSTYVYDPDAPSHGDLGAALGAEIRERAARLGIAVRPVDDGIRATIIGASQYTVQVSGNTNTVSPSAGLPHRNVPVAVVDLTVDHPDAVADRVDAAFRRLDLDPRERLAALAVRWSGRLDYATMSHFCAELLRSAYGAAGDLPLVLLIDHDVAGIVGALLTTELGLARPVVVLDQIEMTDWGYVDIGELDADRNVVPVVVKSLVFK